MRKKRHYIQKTLFGDDELLSVSASKSKDYDPYMQGAVDMFLKMISAVNTVESGKYNKQTKIRHLQRKYMESFIKNVIKDRKTLIRFLQGNKVAFWIEKDDCGLIRSIQAKISNNEKSK